MAHVTLASKPGTNSTRVRQDVSSDSGRVAHERVRVKLGALAYADSRHGADASADLAQASLVTLCEAAGGYYESLTGVSIRGKPIVSEQSAQALARLRVSALSYAGTRHGADACIEFTRDALRGMCGAAIAYAEAVAGGDARPGETVDRTLYLDGGV